MAAGASLELVKVTKMYGHVTAVDAIDLRIPAGSYCCLLGPSGCGKTSTLRMIAGHESATSGDIIVGAKNVTELPPAGRGTAMMFQSYALFPHLSVIDNVAFALKMKGVSKPERHARARDLLELVDMQSYAGRLPAQLSGGQQQRVALARALIVGPETLLLDEPLSNLDANLREEMRFEIRRLHDEYRYTTVYVTHDQSEAMTTADLIAVMNAGKIDQLGSPEDIYARPESEFVARFIGAANVIKGTARDATHVEFGGTILEVVGARLTAGQGAPVAIRQHEIQLSTRPPAATQNTLKAIVTRQVYLGMNRDYMVETPDGTSLRVTTPTETAVEKGREVWLNLPPERCRALSR
jgi:iron(III) transport system ATP-binding protein